MQLVPNAAGDNANLACSNNDTGHWNVFFAKNMEGTP